MPGRILIVDDVVTNRIVLRVKLSAACYDVVQAASGAQALQMIAQCRPNIVLASDRLPDMDGAEFCRAAAEKCDTADTPILLVQSDTSAAARRSALEAGAEDCIRRPVDEHLLMARLRSILRARDQERELQLRNDTGRTLGLAEDAATWAPERRVVLVSSGAPFATGLIEWLSRKLSAKVTVGSRSSLLRNRENSPDVFVICAMQNGDEALELLSELRSRSGPRRPCILFTGSNAQRREAATALDVGADDIMIGPADREELALRVEKLIERKRRTDRLRADVEEGLRAAWSDPLTGLPNRRYALPYLQRLVDDTSRDARDFAVVLADIDRFKSVNDRYGHATGDKVLVKVGKRLSDRVRHSGLVARHGGEEFLILLHGTDKARAIDVAASLCESIRKHPIDIGGPEKIPVTLSAGIAFGSAGCGQDADAILAAADAALYAAKHAGRDRLVVAQDAYWRDGIASIAASSRSA